MASEPQLSVIEDSVVHVRSSVEREWDWFPETADSHRYSRTFNASDNTEPWTLSVRQQNVKQGWEVRLNDQALGKLVRDENDTEADFLVPPGGLVNGENHLEIYQMDDVADDVLIGPITLDQISPDRRRRLASVELSLVDGEGNLIPGRITVLNDKGTLIPVGAVSGDSLAVRHGVVYTLDGKASFGIAPGQYRIVATRGFEYSMADVNIHPTAGQRLRHTFVLNREVDTAGWVACDTHVHTVTHSGHGDCTIEERMVTLAGEGIELPIATDHNKAIDYRPIAESMGAQQYFTPIIGDECTTKKGHFNVFPIRAGSELPDHTQDDWGPLLEDIRATPDVRVAILNHARDIHSGFRPFSPSHHVSLTGERLDERSVSFNAMEICNSGAVQTDPLQLFRDWCGLINRGLSITPIGCSDSHDVSRFIVGQGRTYIRCDDSNPGNLNVSDSMDALVQGRVMVSYGLLVRLTVNQTASPGDLVTLDSEHQGFEVTAGVHGPSWTRANSVALYLCGRETMRQAIEPESSVGSSRKASVTWRIPRSQAQHDLWVTAVATGPGISESYWPTALPYQPTSTAFSPSLFAVAGQIRIDCDGDGKFSSPLAYAQKYLDQYQADTAGLIEQMGRCDESVIHQVAALFQAAGGDLVQLESQADGDVAAAISRYRQAYRSSVVAKIEGIQ